MWLSLQCVWGQSDWTTINNGTQFKKSVESLEGKSPQQGDMIRMKLKKYSPQGQLIFSTDMLNADKGVEMNLKDDVLPGDILDVFKNLLPGEKALAKVPIWVADKQERPEGEDWDFYSYEIELLESKTMKEVEEERRLLLSQLRVEEKKLFDEISDKHYSGYHKVYDQYGLYILKKDKKKVKKSQRIASQSEVTTHYRLKLLPDMTIIDQSYSRGEPFTFKVNDGQVIKGWDIAFMQLKRGDQAVLLIPSWLAYGFTGSGWAIGPNTPLLFEVEILK